MEYRVANTKELPGLDRTDDIKTHGTDYLDTLRTLRISQAAHPDNPRWLYDAIIGCSRDHFNEDDLRPLLSADRLL